MKRLDVALVGATAALIASLAGACGWFDHSDQELEQRAAAFYHCARLHPEALPPEIQACANQYLDQEPTLYAPIHTK